MSCDARSIADPVVADLVARIPEVGLRKPRPKQFRRYCECFEWVFNVYYGVNGLRAGPGWSEAEKVRNVDLHASALWHHLHPRVTA